MLADQATYAAKRSGRDAWVGLGAEPGSDATGIDGDGDAVRRLVRDGRLEVWSSVHRDGRSVDWGRQEEQVQRRAGA